MATATDRNFDPLAYINDRMKGVDTSHLREWQKDPPTPGQYQAVAKRARILGIEDVDAFVADLDGKFETAGELTAFIERLDARIQSERFKTNMADLFA